MRMARTTTIPSFFVIAFGLVAAPLSRADKPTVSIAEMMPRATHIVAGKVVSEQLVTPATKTQSGEWLPEKRRVRVQADRVLKTDARTQIPKEFDFDSEALLFEKGELYIFFLTSTATGKRNEQASVQPVRFEHLGSPARRVETKAAAIEEVENELKKDQKAIQPSGRTR